jgi:hypothetical protein
MDELDDDLESEVHQVAKTELSSVRISTMS